MSILAIQILVYVLSIGGGALFLWGWFGDWWQRQRGKRPQRRCPKCWYDLTHTLGMVCSECGYEGKSEKRFSKSRIRKRWCAVALLLLLGSYGGNLYPTITQRGWAAAVPSWVLIAYLPEMEYGPWMDVPGSTDFLLGNLLNQKVSMRYLANELWFRMQNDELARWEYALIVNRAFAGDAARPPTCLNWQRSYGMLLSRLLEIDAVDQERVMAFAVSQWKVDVRAPERWPALLPYPVHLYQDSWWPGSSVTSSGSHLRRSRPKFFLDHFGAVDNRGQFGSPLVKFSWPADVDEDPDLFRFEFKGTMADETAESTIEVTAPQPTPATIAELLTPVESPELTALLAEQVTTRVVVGGAFLSGYPVLSIEFWRLRDYFESHDAPTVGVHVEILRDGKVMYTSRGWVWTRDTAPLAPEAARVLSNLAIQFRLPAGERGAMGRQVPRDDLSKGNWTIRLRSDAATALLNFDCDKYWVGEVTMPLRLNE